MKPLIILILSCALLPSLLHAKQIALKCTVDEVSEHSLSEIGEIWNYVVDAEANTVIRDYGSKEQYGDSIDKYGPEDDIRSNLDLTFRTYLTPLWLPREIRWKQINKNQGASRYYAIDKTLNRSTLELKSSTTYWGDGMKHQKKHSEHASCEIVKIVQKI